MATTTMTIDEKIQQAEKTLSLEKDKEGKIAKVIMANIEKYKAQKKNEQQQLASEQNRSQQAEKQQDQQQPTSNEKAHAISIPSPHVATGNTSLPNNENPRTEVEMKDYYYFVNIEAGYEYRIWKARLRQKLLNFMLMTNKTKIENKKIEVDFYVRGCLENIFRLIDESGRTGYKEILMKKKYSIGSKALEKSKGREIYFSFDYKELKKDFGF